MATEFQKAREAALRANKSSFSYGGKRFRTTVPGKDAGDLMSGPRPGDRITFERPAAPPTSVAPATSSARPSSAEAPAPSRGLRIPSDSPTRDEAPAPRPAMDRPRADRAAGIAAARGSDPHTSVKDERPKPAKRDGELSAEELVEEAKRATEERTAAATKRREDAEAGSRRRRASVDDEDRDTGAGEDREFARKFPPLSDTAGYRERLERRQAIEQAQGKDPELKALNDAITRATKANNTVLVNELTSKRTRLLRQRYGERGLGERSMSAFD